MFFVSAPRPPRSIKRLVHWAYFGLTNPTWRLGHVPTLGYSCAASSSPRFILSSSRKKSNPNSSTTRRRFLYKSKKNKEIHQLICLRSKHAVTFQAMGPRGWRRRSTTATAAARALEVLCLNHAPGHHRWHHHIYDDSAHIRVPCSR